MIDKRPVLMKLCWNIVVVRFFETRRIRVRFIWRILTVDWLHKTTHTLRYKMVSYLKVGYPHMQT